MRRREFITLLGGAAAWPLVAAAQDNVARLGVLGPPRDNTAVRFAYPLLFEELRKLGFAENRNLIVEFRRIDEGVPKAFAGANELVAAKANVLFAFGPELALQAADAAHPAVPIVILANNYDPIARGYVKGLAHLGGNVTGIVSAAWSWRRSSLRSLSRPSPIGPASPRCGIRSRPTSSPPPSALHNRQEYRCAR